MKKRILLAVVIVVAALIWLFGSHRPHAQGPNINMTATSGAPSGACGSYIADVDLVTWKTYTCQSGSWVLMSSPPLTGTTGSIGGSLLALGGNSSGTASITGATTSMACIAQPSDGTNMAALGLSVQCSVTANGVATISIVSFVTVTPAAKTYNVRVFP